MKSHLSCPFLPGPSHIAVDAPQIQDGRLSSCLQRGNGHLSPRHACNPIGIT